MENANWKTPTGVAIGCPGHDLRFNFVKVHALITKLWYNRPMKTRNENAKKNNKNVNKMLCLLLAMAVAFAMCMSLGACGNDAATEETVEITTPAEEADTQSEEAEADESDQTDGDDSEDKDDSDSKDKGDKKSDSQYKTIYKSCDAKMKKATEKYTKELKDKSGSLSKSDLYDETQDKIEALKEIYNDGKDKMIDAMLKSTDDDADEYNKYFNKMTESYTEYSRSLTTVYTDAF